MKEQGSEISKKVMIQDIVVVAPKMEHQERLSSGEFGDPVADEKNQTHRLFTLIENLIGLVSQKHGKQSLNNENYITRLVTNEFLFYTKTPLSILEFELLQQKVFDLAKKQSENVHCVLSSFAVQTPDNKVMDVVVYLQCGEKPCFNFIVKNNSSDVDPVYVLYEENDSGRKKLKNVDINHTQLADYSLLINEIRYPFSYQNIVECKTQGNVPFWTGVDICLDYAEGVALNNVRLRLHEVHSDYIKEKSNQLLPDFFSHIVSSHVIELKAKKSIGTVTHADPIFSIQNCKKEVEQSKAFPLETAFGSPLVGIEISPMALEQWPEDLAHLVSAHNQMVFGIENETNKVLWLNAEKQAKALSEKPPPLTNDMLDDLDSEEEEDPLREILEHGLNRLIKSYSSTHAKSSKQCTWGYELACAQKDQSSGKLFLKEKLQSMQIEFVKILKNSNNGTQNAKLAHSFIIKTMQEIIEKNHNLKTSNVYQLCEKKMKKLERAYPKLKRAKGKSKRNII